MLWLGLVRVRRTSRFWLEYQFCLRNIWKRPQLLWRVENRWKHLQVLLKMTTVWLELQSAALLAVLIIIDIIILLFFHWSIISSMSLFSLSVRACEQSVDSSFPRLLVSCPLRGVSRCLCTHYIPIRTAVEEHCVNLLIRPPRRSCTANIQTHLLPLCVAAGEWKWLKVDAICIHENNENLLMGVFKSGTKCWDIVLLCLCFSCERSPALLLSLLNRTDGGGVMCTHTHAAERRVSERNNWIGGLWSLHSKPELWQLPGDALPPSLLCALCMQDWWKMYSDVLLKD